MWAIRNGASWQEVVGSFAAGNVQYPATWPALASDADRAAIGLAEIGEGDPQPRYATVTGRDLVDVDGKPVWRWVADPLTIDQVRTSRLAELAALRWDKQQTVTWNGRVAPADDVTIGRVTAAAMRAQVTGDSTATVKWKLGDDFVDLTVAEITAYGVAIGAHMQACFDREAVLAGEIGAATDVAALAAIDITAGWPA